jgi:rubrerythrin
VDTQQILRPLQQLEEKLGELYFWLAGVHAADVEAAAVFTRLARDEKSHAAQVEFQRKLARQNPRLFGQVELDLGEIFRVLERIEKLRANLDPPTVDDAIRVAIELESSAAEYHFRNVVAQLDPSMAKLLGSLGRGDSQHYETLLDLAQRRGLIGPDTPLPPPPPLPPV